MRRTGRCGCYQPDARQRDEVSMHDGATLLHSLVLPPTPMLRQPRDKDAYAEIGRIQLACVISYLSTQWRSLRLRACLCCP
jgi:hypothetical protein